MIENYLKTIDPNKTVTIFMNRKYKSLIKDHIIVLYLNMMHYAATSVVKINKKLRTSNNYQYISINKDLEIEFYIYSFSQLIYTIQETLKNLFENQIKDIDKIFRDKDINEWLILSNKIKHNNLRPIKTLPINIQLNDNHGVEHVDFGKEYHSIRFEKNKTRISIDKIEDNILKVHKKLLTLVENFYAK